MDRPRDGAEGVGAAGLVGRVLGGRYTLRAPLGGGRHGGVWSAWDRIAGEEVALKLLEAESREESLLTRREIAALRSVQCAGVVRMLDEGVDEGQVFLVMERVRGEPFPGRSSTCAWHEIDDTVRALVETLARIHAAGVVHRDIKPSNVLVADGRPVVLDFGVSWGALDGPHRRGAGLVGTPAYMAPEQLMGEPTSAASDLYALGVMLYEALTGRLPVEHENLYAMMMARCSTDAPSLRAAALDAPEAVIDAIDALLLRDPAKRLASARDLLDRLRGKPSRLSWLGASGSPTLARDELRELVEGPSRFFHVPDDAVEVLWRRTGGVRERVRAELDGWVLAGFARRDGPRVALEREAVERLMQAEVTVDLPVGAPLAARACAHAAAADALAAGAPGRLGHMLRALAGAAEGASAAVLDEACAAARRALFEGRAGRGVAALADAWLAVLRVGEAVPPACARRFFEAWAELALLDARPASVDRLLHELARAPAGAELGDLDALLRAWMAVRSDPARALALASALPRYAHPDVERLRHGIVVHAARHGAVDVEDALVASLAAWAEASGDARDRAAYAGWCAWVLYRRGRYLDAAERHLESARLDPSPASSLAALLSAASSLIEGFEPQRALAIAVDAEARAARDRLPYLEARAAWLQRMARYRACEALTPDVDLVGAIAAMGVGNMHAVAALTEAAVAWRCGALETGRALAMEACGVWSSMGLAFTRGLAFALALACGEAASGDELAALVTDAVRCPIPAVGIQTLALCAVRHAAAVASVSPALAGLAAHVPSPRWGQRVDVLTINEAIEMLEGASRRAITDAKGSDHGED